MNLTLKTHQKAFYEIKKSRFIAYLEPHYSANDFHQRRQELLTEHLKANHVCYAWRRHNDRQIEEGFSDDGEPSGTVGMPLLKILQQHSMVDTQLLVVRYFGGIKLGTGGLMRGYTAAAKLCMEEVIENGGCIKFQTQSSLDVSVSFATEQYLRIFCQQQSILIMDPCYTEQGIDAILVAPRATLEEFINHMRNQRDIWIRGQIQDL